MCPGFGDMKTTEQTTKTTSLPDYLSNAAQTNVANAGNVTSTPFQAYTAPRVADLSGDQQAAGGLIRATAGASDPYTDQIKALFDRYSNTAAPSISAPSILGPGVDPRTASISDYINPYVDATLQPTLDAIARSGAAARQRSNATATMAGAFGDSGHGILRSADDRNETTQVRDATGQAYNTAFNTAAALRGQDVGNLLTTQKANADYGLEALQRAITGGGALTNLDKYDTGRTLDLANALDKSGAEQRGVAQTKLDADYQEFMRKLGYGPDDQADDAGARREPGQQGGHLIRHDRQAG
jgi:hypothetical protein